MLSAFLLHLGAALLCAQSPSLPVTNVHVLASQGSAFGIHQTGSLGGSPLAAAGSPIVGLLEVAKPSVPSFTLHGTLPVPAGTFLGNEVDSPLTVLDENGNPVPTQLEVVAWHPNAADGAAVVEVIAHLDTPTGPETTLQYAVQMVPQSRKNLPPSPTLADLIAGPDNLPAPVKSILTTPGQLILAAEDPFGNIYLLDLVHDAVYDQGAREVKRYGKVQTEIRHHGMMRPLQSVLGAKGTLPHMFGVHSYLRFSQSDSSLELDLRLHNGADGSTDGAVSNEALAALYFKRIVLLIPGSWVGKQNYSDPGLGKLFSLGNYLALPLVAANADGSMHYFPQQGQMERRISLAPGIDFARAISHAEDEGLAFSKPGPFVSGKPVLWSWWNQTTATYFPQRHLLPLLPQIPTDEFRKELAIGYNEIKGHMEQGTGQGIYPYESNALGWAHPYGVAYGGMTGGDGIYFTWGLRTLLASSLSGYRRLQLLHRMDTDRQPNALYRFDGSPSNLYDWLTTQSGKTYMPFGYYMHPTGTNDPFGFTTAPTFQADWVKAQGLQPTYEQELSGYAHIDIQHLVRYTGPAKSLVWMGNDSLAKDDLEQQAESFHLSYHVYDNSFYDHVQGTGQKSDRIYADTYPGEGLPFGRAEGWGVDVMAAAYATGDPAFRAEKLPWFEGIAKLLNDGQDACTGIIESKVYIKFLGGNYRGRQITEMSIVENALVGVIRSVFTNVSPAANQIMTDVLVDSLYAMVSPESWDPANSAPWSELATGPVDLTLPPFCGAVPADGMSSYTNEYQQWASLAYGLEFTGDPIFLYRAESMFGKPLAEMTLDTKLPNLGNRSAMHALVEFLLSFP